MINCLDTIKATKKIRVGVFGDIPGHSFFNTKTQIMEGFEADLARLIAIELFGSENHIEFIAMYPDACVKALQESRIDMAICHLTISPNRLEVIEFSQPYLTDTYAFLVHKNSPINHLSDLNGKKVTIRTGGSAFDDLKKYLPKTKLIVVKNKMEAIEDLRNNKTDAYSADCTFMRLFKESLIDADQFKIIGIEPEDQLPKYIAVGMKKGCTDLVNFVNSCLSKFETNGQLKDLLKKHSIV